MNALTRTAVAAVLFLCLASTASAADGVGTGPDTSANDDGVIIREYNSREEAEAALRREIDAEAENAKKVPLSVDECRVIVTNDTLYKDIDRSALPPIDQPMPMLSEMFGGMLGMPKLQLVVTEGREAKSEKAVQTGYPTRWFRVVDIGSTKLFRLANGKQIVSSLALEIVHKKKATKSFSNDINFFVYDAAGHPLMRVSMGHLPDPIPVKSTAELLNLISSTKGVPLAEGDREYAIAQHVLQTAVPAEIPAGK